MVVADAVVGIVAGYFPVRGPSSYLVLVELQQQLSSDYPRWLSLLVVYMPRERNEIKNLSVAAAAVVVAREIVGVRV